MALPTPAHTLRVYSGDPSVADRERGFAKIPNWILALPDLHPTGKILLNALVGSCYNGERSCHVKRRKLTDKTGLKTSVVKYWMGRLVDLGFILRREDASGEAWETTLLFDPLGLEDTRPVRAPLNTSTSPTPANPLADPGQPISRPRLMGSPPFNTTSEIQLPLFENSPLTPEGEGEGSHPRTRKTRRKTRRQEIMDSYREWANEADQ